MPYPQPGFYVVSPETRSYKQPISMRQCFPHKACPGVKGIAGSAQVDAIAAGGSSADAVQCAEGYASRFKHKQMVQRRIDSCRHKISYVDIHGCRIWYVRLVNPASQASAVSHSEVNRSHISLVCVFFYFHLLQQMAMPRLS